MVVRVGTVAFIGLEARIVDVECQLTTGLPAFVIVGLADKAVSESRERVRGALASVGLALPPKRITINLSPADLPKEGAHYDLPIAMAVLGAMGVVDGETLASALVLGELGLDGRIGAVPGVLLAAIAAHQSGLGLICPWVQGAEAHWAGPLDVTAAPDLMALIDHMRGRRILPPPPAGTVDEGVAGPDLAQVKGQEQARRALEITAAGGHNLMMIGPPGVGKSLLAACLPGILPELQPVEALEISMIASIAGTLTGGQLRRTRPYRAPHHSASMAALTGGGMRAKPGEISLAHRGVLFLDELPEFQRGALDALRQPLETGAVSIARAAAHVTYPANFQLVAAMNPCRCGHLADAARACSRAPRCAVDYQARISGPLLDRIDLHVEFAGLTARELVEPASGESSAIVGARVAEARARQSERYGPDGPRTNAEAEGEWLDAHACPDEAGRTMLMRAVDRLGLSARGYTRVLRVARTIADLAGRRHIGAADIGEALGYRARAMNG